MVGILRRDLVVTVSDHLGSVWLHIGTEFWWANLRCHFSMEFWLL